jgi:hypothetical protein
MLLRCQYFIFLTVLFLNSLCFCHNVPQKYGWTLCIYMEATDHLTDMAWKNINDMLKAPIHDNVTVVIQLHAIDNVAYRYQIKDHTLIQLEEVILNTEVKTDVFNAIQWAFGSFAASHHMLILWNHGFGILDPQWNEEQSEWVTEFDEDASCPLTKRSCYNTGKEIHKSSHKGYIFSLQPRTYMKSNELVAVLDAVQKNILNGKKIDILGFDTCMGSMIETAYQVAPYVHYLIGAQSCSLRDGWNFKTFLSHFHDSSVSPYSASCAAVAAFEHYYEIHDEKGIYAQSAIDLTYMHELAYHCKNFVQLFNTCAKQYTELHTLIAQARRASPRFCIFPFYTDLYTLYEIIAHELRLLSPSEKINELLRCIEHQQKLIKQAIIATCAGSNLSTVIHGLSCYAPLNHIDSSYYTTLFDQYTHWSTFLAGYIQGNSSLIY